MDDLPIRSYVEKGFLADLTEYSCTSTVWTNALTIRYLIYDEIEVSLYGAGYVQSCPIEVGKSSIVVECDEPVSDLATD